MNIVWMGHEVQNPIWRFIACVAAIPVLVAGIVFMMGAIAFVMTILPFAVIWHVCATQANKAFGWMAPSPIIVSRSDGALKSIFGAL